MANQTDNKMPKIRFKGFKEEWNEKLIGEVVSETKRPIILEDDKAYELITVKRRNGGVVSRGHLMGRDILVKNYSQLQAGDFVISKRQVVHGATGMVPEALDKAIVSNEYLVVEGNDKISTEFLTLLASLPDMKRKFFLSSYGVDIEKLFFDIEDWKQRIIIFPNTSEQSRISAFFKELNRNIELYQRKNDKLVMLKRTMLQKMFPSGDSTKPDIRFKGFGGDWEVRPLGELTLPLSNNSLSRANLNEKSGPARNIHYGDILVKFGEVIDGDTSDLPFISNDSIIEKFESSRLQDGDIVFVDAAEDFSVGKCAEILNVGDQLIFAGLHTIALRPTIRFAPAYLGYFLNSSSFHNQLLPLMQGTKVLSISKKVLKETVLSYPKKIKEQEKIGNYFRKLDALIHQNTTQLEKLKQLKLACLGKMFV